jgi:hypothetical protein
VTFDDVRKFALLWLEVEDGTSCGRPALKVRKKLLARLREDAYLTTPDVKPALRLGGLMSFFRKQCASLPA